MSGPVIYRPHERRPRPATPQRAGKATLPRLAVPVWRYPHKHNGWPYTCSCMYLDWMGARR